MRQRGSCEAGGGLRLIALLESLNIEAATLLLRLIDRLQKGIIVVSGLCISIAWPQDR